VASNRRVRRSAGFIIRFVTDDLLGRVVDPRSSRGRVWKSSLPLLKAVLLGLLCGCKGLREVEELTAEMARRHNDANVLCLPADLIGEELTRRMVDVWLNTSFEGGRHERRIRKIGEYEHKEFDGQDEPSPGCS